MTGLLQRVLSHVQHVFGLLKSFGLVHIPAPRVGTRGVKLSHLLLGTLFVHFGTQRV